MADLGDERGDALGPDNLESLHGRVENRCKGTQPGPSVHR
jgi:hypothetical protein